ncbi:S41 family peptidase [Polyangium spumosum]|uniref:Peptidase S41 n=1 Tax=Polyangium spumosum TaxID=889282 RepID=A0A6N7PI72_9BACT|nr:S41 family peptidase [Polyangium spumosum]MRG91507.1 peptidase S41 [Polyangium spumosum]
MRTSLFLLGSLFLTACELVSSTPPSSSTSSSTGSGGAGGDGGSGGGGNGGSGGGFSLDCSPKPAPELPPEAFCARVAPGAPGARPLPVDLSAAHAGVRFFGPVDEYADADQALAAALLPADGLEALDLAPYAGALPGITCALPANVAASSLDVARVDIVDGDVALVRPGAGPVEVPPEVTAIVVDLRGLPPAPGLREALDVAVAEALAAPVPRLARRVRRHYGMTDEQFTPTNLYKNTIAEVDDDPIPAASSAERKLALLTSERLAPEAASLALSLRLAGRATIVGEGLRADVAEARWQGIGPTGITYRIADLILPDGRRVPDTIPADRRMAEPACIVHEIEGLAAPAPITPLPAERPEQKSVSPFNKRQPPEVDLGTARAALVVAHGAARTFFPYFDVVPDVIDERLVETLGTLGQTPPERPVVRNLLRRFGNALDDSHTLVRDYVTKPAGSFPSYLEWIDGEAVVRQTLAVGVEPGDTLVSIDGVPAADWYTTELARSSGATDAYRFVVASYEVQQLQKPIELGLRDPDGGMKTLQFQPQPLADFGAVGFTPTLRPAGWLADLGAPKLYYINLTGEILYDMADFNAALTEAGAADGLILDMRGFPGVNLAEVAQRVIPGPWSGAIFRVAMRTGPDDVTIDEFADTFGPLESPSYGGPLVLLVGNGTLSAAEHFSLALVDANRATVVGRGTAGTDGNITGVQLPGQFALSFTGLEIRHADAQKSVFHGVGIIPDIEVTLSAAAFRDGVDPELDAAIDHLLAAP